MFENGREIGATPADATPAAKAASKRERTRAAIRESAIRLFRERGYEATTLRLVAADCGLAVGSAYYHFPSKQHLVQEVFVDAVVAQSAAAAARFATEETLVPRIRIAFETGIASLQPYAAHAGEFLAAMTAPSSPVNPLSTESGPAREIAVGVFRDAVAGARGTLPRDIEEALPEALWTAFLLLALFWVSDASPGRTRTAALLDRGLRLLATALPLLRLPVLRAPAREFLGLLTAVRS